MCLAQTKKSFLTTGSAFWGQSFVGQLTSIADQAKKKEDAAAAAAAAKIVAVEEVVVVF